MARQSNFPQLGEKGDTLVAATCCAHVHSSDRIMPCPFPCGISLLSNFLKRLFVMAPITSTCRLSSLRPSNSVQNSTSVPHHQETRGQWAVGGHEGNITASATPYFTSKGTERSRHRVVQCGQKPHLTSAPCKRVGPANRVLFASEYWHLNLCRLAFQLPCGTDHTPA